MATREFRQCWAYDDNGNRCTSRAGHSGLHMRKIEWDDSQCAGAPLIDVFADAPIPLAIVPEQEQAVSCVACMHRHRAGECRCGCKEFIG